MFYYINLNKFREEYFLSSIEQKAETLSSFGLTVKQAKVYLTLVFLGTSVVGEISKLSKVRREEVYRVMPKLEKMGLFFQAEGGIREVDVTGVQTCALPI